MDVPLTPELMKLLDAKVESGLYGSVKEVLQDALQLLEERDKLREARMAELKHEIQRGIDQLDRGQSATLDIEAIKTKARLQPRLEPHG